MEDQRSGLPGKTSKQEKRTSALQRSDIDIAYFSWTGNTKSVVDVIVKELSPPYNPRILPIQPKRNYPYFLWLISSFIPALGVSITCAPVTAPTVILAIPKWTVNCAPITTFLRKGYVRGKKVFLVITYGGFDQDRYAESYRNKVSLASAGVKDVLLVKRRNIQEGNFENVKAWTKMISLKD